MAITDRITGRIADVRTIRRLFTAAEQLAAADGREEPGAEDLLLAACRAPDGSAARALAAVGLTPDELSAAVRRVHADALPPGLDADGVGDDRLPPPARPRGVYRSTGSFQELFGEVRRRVASTGARLDGAWFLLAAADQRHGTVARALDHLGVDRSALAAAASAELG